MEVARELLHEHSVAQPHILFVYPSLFCRLECEAGIGKLFWGERLEDRIARSLHEHSTAQPHILFVCPSLYDVIRVDVNVGLALISMIDTR